VRSVDASANSKAWDSPAEMQTAIEAKLSATELQGRVVDMGVQMHGGYGYMMEYPVAKAFVDARIQRIYGGTNEIIKEIIHPDLLRS
jgi:alkylation response protein AidB-like acyl-CoA dehydrogenase